MTLARDAGLRRLLGLRGEVALLRVEGSALVGNALGDPHVRDLPVYLPPTATRDRPVPAVYVLPGYAADARGALTGRPWSPSLVARLDGLIAHGLVDPIALIVVDGWTRLGGGQYVDSVHNGRHADFVVDDVVPAAEAALPILAGPRARGLLGKSSGGFGALHLAMRRPDRFGAIAAHSADGGFPYAAYPAFVAAWRELRAVDGDLAAFVAGVEATGGPASPAAFETMTTLAYAAAYSPRSARPFDLDLPFRREDGRPDDDVLARWRAFDPVEEVERPERADALRALALCFIDCGDRDEHALDLAAHRLARRLEGSPNLVYETYRGGHRGNEDRYDRSLARLGAALARAR